MVDPFGPTFYQWWAGLARSSRWAVAGVIVALSGISAWLFPDAWLVWGPTAIAGLVLLLLA